MFLIVIMGATAKQASPAMGGLAIGLMLTLMPLPDWAESFRPDWVAMILIFWAMQLPRTWSVGSAFMIGIVLDVAQGTLLGQHALALAVVTFATVRFHLLMRVFPLSQLTATVFALLANHIRSSSQPSPESSSQS